MRLNIKRYDIPKVRVVPREGELIKLCDGKRVLHLGCTDFPFTRLRGPDLLHCKLSKVARELYGVDSSEEGVRALEEMGFSNIYLGNVERLDLLHLDAHFDYVLAGEIVEHLANPGLFLQTVPATMSPDTQLIVTVPNAFSIKSFIHSMLRREKVHEDHNYWFSFRTILQLLQKSQFVCCDIYFYQAIEGEGMEKALDVTLSWATKLSPCFADGLIVRAKLAVDPLKHPKS